MIPLYAFPGQRADSVIYHGGDGLYYHLNNNRPNRRFAYLRCIHSDNSKIYCPGTAKALLNAHVMCHLRGHSHEPKTNRLSVLSLRKDVIARVKMGDQTPFHEIIQQEGQNYSLDVRANLGAGSLYVRLAAIRATLRPPVPRNLGVLGACLLLPKYKYLTSCLHIPESMFAGVCGTLGDKTLSLVFITTEMKMFMETRSMIFADGTQRKLFRKPKASQIYQIVGIKRFHIIPMLRAIMIRRSERAYTVLFEYIKTLVPRFRPQSIKCDFEDAQVNAWKAAFPYAKVEGCLWHYDCAVFLHARKKLGLYELVKEEEEVASIIRAAGALPLLPTNEIEQGLEDLGHETVDKGWMPELKDFFKYMVKEWIPKVPVLSVKDSVHRTNNGSESANRGFNKAVGTSNPNCFQVIRAFVTTNERAVVDLRTLDALLEPGRGRKVSALRNDAVIKRLTREFDAGEITRLDFLHNASRRMQNVFNTCFR